MSQQNTKNLRSIFWKTDTELAVDHAMYLPVSNTDITLIATPKIISLSKCLFNWLNITTTLCKQHDIEIPDASSIENDQRVRELCNRIVSDHNEQTMAVFPRANYTPLQYLKDIDHIDELMFNDISLQIHKTIDIHYRMACNVQPSRNANVEDASSINHFLKMFDMYILSDMKQKSLQHTHQMLVNLHLIVVVMIDVMLEVLDEYSREQVFNAIVEKYNTEQKNKKNDTYQLVMTAIGTILSIIMPVYNLLHPNPNIPSVVILLACAGPIIGSIVVGWKLLSKIGK